MNASSRHTPARTLRSFRRFLSTVTATAALGLALSMPAHATGTIGTPTPVGVGLSCKDFDTAGILSELVINPLPDGIQAHTDGVLSVDTIHFESTSGWLLYWSS